MPIYFDSFKEWIQECEDKELAPWRPVLEYEISEKQRSEEEIWGRLERVFSVMKEAIKTGLTEDIRSVSGMVNNGAKKVRDCSVNVLDENFKELVYHTLAAKEVNSAMGIVVAAPTAGASGIMPGVLYMLQKIHKLPDRKIYEAMLVSAGIGLIIEKKASIAGAVGGCQAETGTAAAMAAGAVVYALGGNIRQIANSVSIVIMDMLGLICDPIAGLVEIPCVMRNASASAIAFAAAQMGIADYDAVIPTDEVVETMGRVGQAMPVKYKETALGGLAATPTGKKIAKKIWKNPKEIINENKEEASREND